MVKALKYLIRVILLIVIIYELMIILGEPEEGADMWYCIWLKISGAFVIWLCSRIWLLTKGKKLF